MHLLFQFPGRPYRSYLKAEMCCRVPYLGKDSRSPSLVAAGLTGCTNYFVVAYGLLARYIEKKSNHSFTVGSFCICMSAPRKMAQVKSSFV